MVNRQICLNEKKEPKKKNKEIKEKKKRTTIKKYKQKISKKTNHIELHWGGNRHISFR